MSQYSTFLGSKVGGKIEDSSSEQSSGTFDAASSAFQQAMSQNSFPGAVIIDSATSMNPKRYYALVGISKSALDSAANKAASAVQSAYGNSSAEYQLFNHERLRKEFEDAAAELATGAQTP